LPTIPGGEGRGGGTRVSDGTTGVGFTGEPSFGGSKPRREGARKPERNDPALRCSVKTLKTRARARVPGRARRALSLYVPTFLVRLAILCESAGMMGWMDASEALAVCGTDRRPAMGNHGSTRGTRRQVRETRTRAGCRGHAVRATREWSRGRARGRNTRVPVASGRSRTCTDADVRLEEGEPRAAPRFYGRGRCRRDELRPECNDSSERMRKTRV